MALADFVRIQGLCGACRRAWPEEPPSVRRPHGNAE